MPLFSIIIPIYNGEKFIKECLTSVLKQKFSNYEIIIINDHSLDRSLEICKEFKKEYPVIKILNQKKNKGVSFCRNLGVKSSVGEYIIFLDSDDYLMKASLSKLSKFIKQNRNSEMIIGQHNVSSDGDIYEEHLNKANINNEEKVKFINKIPYFTGFCWRVITKRKFLERKNIFFVEAHIYEDEDFFCKLIVYSKFITFFKYKFYFHRRSTNSLGHTINFNSTRSCLVILKSLLKLYELKNMSFQKRKYCESRIAIILQHLYPLLFLTSNKKLTILSKDIYQNMHLFLLLKRIKFENGFKLVLHKEKNNYLLNCKKIIEKNTINKIKNLNVKNFYLFCMDKYSYAVAKILLKHNFKIRGFLDNNHGMKNHSKFNIKFIPIKYAIKKIKKDKDYVIICNQRREHIISIANQLINKGISKKKILIKSFTMNLEEKIKNY